MIGLVGDCDCKVQQGRSKAGMTSFVAAKKLVISRAKTPIGDGEERIHLIPTRRMHISSKERDATRQ